MSCAYLSGGNAFQFGDQDNKGNKGGNFKKLVLLFILALSAAFAFAQPLATPQCLKVKVKPTIDGRAGEKVSIRLYQVENDQVRIDSTDDKSVVFLLDKGHDYSIEISKAGRLSRRVSISTKLPEDIEIGPMFRHLIEIELPPSGKLADDFYMDFPIAVISYNEERDRFEHDKRYTELVMEKMKQQEVQTLIVTK